MNLNEEMPIYLVTGFTGEYEDYHEWIVCAYKDIEMAQMHAKKANEEAQRLFEERPKGMLISMHNSNLDKSMHIDYTGTNYYVEEIVLKSTFRT